MGAPVGKQQEIVGRAYEELLIARRALEGGLRAFVQNEQRRVYIGREALAAFIVVFQYFEDKLLGDRLI